MKRWLVPFALIAACSGRDQSLGETRRVPPIIIDPTPEAGSGTGAISGSGATSGSGSGATSGSGSSSGSDTGGSATSGTGPGPAITPCEDPMRHLPPPRCVPLGSCAQGTIRTGPGFECEANELCCEKLPGCGAKDCSGGGNVGEGGNTGEPLAGAGGN